MRKRLLTFSAAVLFVVGLATPASAQTGAVIENGGIPGRCVDIPGTGAGTVDGPVWQYSCNPAELDNMRFTLPERGRFADGTPYYWIRNTKDGLCLDLPFYGSVPPATKVTEYHCRDLDNQHWVFEHKGDWNGKKWYWIRNVASDLCLDIPGVKDAPIATQLEVYPCLDNDDHYWSTPVPA